MKLLWSTIAGCLGFALIGMCFALIIAGHPWKGVFMLPFAISAATWLIILSTDPQKPRGDGENETLFL